ncbi:MAG: outer membrane lipoprotein carrier protein LolA [Candidatus Solibacter usitatus]|nr:outer membrane lipoprotein carrier protein LolA [Candidatus Solibacter usitatus]
MTAAIHPLTSRRACAAAFLFLLPGLSPAGTLDEVLARMDRSANGFRGLTAKVRKVAYTALVKESTEESGDFSVLRAKPKDMRILVEFTRPDPRAIAFQGKKVQIYYPKTLTVQEYDLGKQGSLIDQFLLLGFGTPGSELRKSYAIKYGGEETINGVKTDRLELTPASSEAQKHVKLIEIWISHPEGNTVQQKVHQPSRDYVLFSYSEIKINPRLTEDSVKLKLPKGVKKETPLK